jgi:serine protease Do
MSIAAVMPTLPRGLLFILAVICSLISACPSLAQIPAFSGGVPTLAPLVRQVTPSVVNLSVQGRIKEGNPLYRDPQFREFFDAPKEREREIQAVGSGVIVDAQRGYVLTANHVVEQVSTVQVRRRTDAALSPSLSVATRLPT